MVTLTWHVKKRKVHKLNQRPSSQVSKPTNPHSFAHPVCRPGGWSCWRCGEGGPERRGSEPRGWQSLAAGPWAAPPALLSSAPLAAASWVGWGTCTHTHTHAYIYMRERERDTHTHTHTYNYTHTRTKQPCGGPGGSTGSHGETPMWGSRGQDWQSRASTPVADLQECHQENLFFLLF